MSENLSREIAAARSELLQLDEYKIELDVSEAQTDTPYFHVISRISFTQLNPGSFHLDFIGSQVTSVSVDEVDIPFRYDGARITFAPLQPGKHEIAVAGTGIYSTSGEGLHRFRDPLDQETYLYTQFEPADSRRVFPNCEQPDLKAKFSIAITAPEPWKVLSNGAEIHVQPAGDNSQSAATKRVIFATTKPMSTYLTAFIAGPYHRFSDVFTSSDGKVELGYYCRKTLAQYFDFTDINTVTKQGLETFPAAFGMSYQWGKYDSVFVPEYNLGAMENPGCVTFNEDKYIHRSHTTRADAATRANTILHEMSHMWFGDLVTPKWWDDLWLKESFAEFMGAWACVQATQYKEAWQAFTGTRLSWALENDQYPTTHPIIAQVPDLEAADQVFDGITYAKGAAVLRQLVAWVGEDAFFAGTRQYFSAHAFGSATFADLLDALADASGKDLHAWSKLWFETAGVSTVQVERKEAGVQLTQLGFNPATGAAIVRPHLIQVSGWKLNSQGVLAPSAQVNVELQDELFIPWDQLGGATCDAVLPNDGALSYLKVQFDPDSREAFLRYDVTDPLSRAVVMNALWQQVRDANLTVATYLDFVQRNAELSDTSLLAQLLQTAVQSVKRYVPAARREELAAALLQTAFAQTEKHSEDDDCGVLWRLAVANLAPFVPAVGDRVRKLLDTCENQVIRWKLLGALAALNQLLDNELNAELNAHNSAQDRVACLEAKSSVPGTQHQTLANLLDPTAEYSNLEIAALAHGFVVATTPTQARAAFPNFFDELDQIWADRSQEIAERIIYGIFPRTEILLNQPNLELPVQRAARQWIAAQGHENALVKIVRDCLDESYRDSHVQAFNA